MLFSPSALRTLTTSLTIKPGLTQTNQEKNNSSAEQDHKTRKIVQGVTLWLQLLSWLLGHFGVLQNFLTALCPGFRFSLHHPKPGGHLAMSS